ncbi:glycosyltransferase family 2 protein [Butyrivibrio fibrisolvens]|uniref:glycosyltransferase family 2 protein n=1 Tax=Butyrivibrio fibrisolvens TaxID=831 RepID=UPI000428D1EA|nr:glycosyltransferase family 2 protein [Butyrivibrio fibrisolvens]
MISIIMPVYNAEKYVEETIKSILNQTFRDFELIMIDDGSKDSSRTIIDKYLQIDSRTKGIFFEKNRGVSCAREAGFKAAAGEYISFMDADDIIHPRMYEVLYESLLNNSADISVCDFCEFNNELKWGDISHRILTIDEYNGIDVSERMILGKEIGSAGLWGKIYSKNLFNAVDYEVYKRSIPICFFEDGFILPSIYANANKVVHVKETLYGYRIFMQSLSHGLTNGYYFMNQAKAGIENTIFIEKFSDKSTYEHILKRQIESSMLCVMKGFYSYSRYKKDRKKRDDARSYFLYVYRKYQRECLVHSKTNDIQFKMFYFSPFLWTYLVAIPYFEFIRRLG